MILALFLSCAAAPMGTNPPRGGIPPGTYIGNVLFTLTHEWNVTSPGVAQNTYSLVIEGKAAIRFTVNGDGSFQGFTLASPSISYTVDAQAVVEGDSPCKGYITRGGGIGSMSAPPALGSDHLYLPSVKIRSGEVWGGVQPLGDCGPAPSQAAMIEAVAWDIDSMPDSQWDFTTDSRFTTKLAGTCKSQAWTFIGRSMSCYWQATRLPAR
jgi:hypothetical protein